MDDLERGYTHTHTHQAWLPEVLKDDAKKLWPPDISV